MKTASGAMIALLNSNVQLYRADLLTITQANGTITRLTSADLNLTVGGNTFLSTGPRFTRTKTTTVIGFSVGQLTLTIQCDPVAHLLGGVRDVVDFMGAERFAGAWTIATPPKARAA